MVVLPTTVPVFSTCSASFALSHLQFCNTHGMTIPVVNLPIKKISLKCLLLFYRVIILKLYGSYPVLCIMSNEYRGNVKHLLIHLFDIVIWLIMSFFIALSQCTFSAQHHTLKQSNQIVMFLLRTHLNACASRGTHER